MNWTKVFQTHYISREVIEIQTLLTFKQLVITKVLWATFYIPGIFFFHVQPFSILSLYWSAFFVSCNTRDEQMMAICLSRIFHVTKKANQYRQIKTCSNVDLDLGGYRKTCHNVDLDLWLKRRATTGNAVVEFGTNAQWAPTALEYGNLVVKYGTNTISERSP